jgi:glycosyltransferase involved in cell wall biosynthesis
MGRDQKIKVCHLMSGDLWAGAEVQLYTMLDSMKAEPELSISVILLNEGKLAQKLRESGLDTLVIDEGKHNFLQIRKKIVQHLRGRGIDIIHSHRYKENMLAALVKTKCGVRALVQTVHGTTEPFTGWKKLKARLYTALNNYYTKRYFDRVLPVSSDIEGELANRYGRERLVTIHNAVDMDKITPNRTADDVRNEFGLSSHDPVIGTAGRMVPVKGYDLLLKAAGIIVEQKPAVRFLIAGDGPERAALEKKCRDMHLGDQVQFIGFRDDITDIINCLDLFVMSSLHEGIPMILLEAMALRKPVVCTSVGGMKEVVEDNVSGLLVEPGDANRLAGSCLNVLDDSELRLKLGTAARKRISDEFSTGTQKERLMSVYRNLMEQG